jgi:hypothetical protein
MLIYTDSSTVPSHPLTENDPKHISPRFNLPPGCHPHDSDPNPIREEDLDLNNVQVIDDLSINRWLMRIMRLGANYVSTGSNGYKSAAGKSAPSGAGGCLNSLRSGGRRFSACEPATALLRPSMTSRGRRLSDCVNLNPHHNSYKYQRRGAVATVYCN